MNDETAEYEPNDSLPVKETKLPEGLRFVDVETPYKGREAGEKAMTLFVPQGYSTPTWIHLEEEDDNRLYTLIVNPLTGRTELKDGRVEMERKGF